MNIFTFSTGIANSIGLLSCVIMAPFAKKSIKVTGDVNMVLLCSMVVGFELILYAFITYVIMDHNNDMEKILRDLIALYRIVAMINFPFYFRLSPPYHVYVISLLTFLLLQYNWISCIQYSYRVAPPTLVATVIALNSCFQNMLGNLNK